MYQWLASAAHRRPAARRRLAVMSPAAPRPLEMSAIIAPGVVVGAQWREGATIKSVKHQAALRRRARFILPHHQASAGGASAFYAIKRGERRSTASAYYNNEPKYMAANARKRAARNCVTAAHMCMHHQVAQARFFFKISSLSNQLITCEYRKWAHSNIKRSRRFIGGGVRRRFLAYQAEIVYVTHEMMF